jgi:hypothetical protein
MQHHYGISRLDTLLRNIVSIQFSEFDFELLGDYLKQARYSYYTVLHVYTYQRKKQLL